MELLDKIKHLCNEKGETLASLERKLGFGNGTIGRWDKASPTVERLTKVADFFGVGIDYLLDRAPALDNVYLSYLQRAQNEGIDPDDLELALQTILAIRAKGAKD